MKKFVINTIIVILCLNLLVVENSEANNNVTNDIFSNLAFPTAEGFGKNSNGFRGGRVIKVTNLNDSGEGSLRWALEEEKGPRIVVFDVGGVIELESKIFVGPENGNVYIAGQTAPGDGITIIKNGIHIYGSNDVAVRNLRIRLGGESESPESCILVEYSSNCIVDHCSLSWSNGPVYFTKNTLESTIQNCVIAEPLIDSYSSIDDGPDGTYSIGTGVFSNGGSIYSNLFVNCMNRNIYCQKRTVSDLNKLEITNNVFYNWKGVAIEGSCYEQQMISNLFKSNLYNSSYLYDFDYNNNLKIYMSGNIFNDKVADWDFIKESNDSIENIKCSKLVIDSGIETVTASESYLNVLENSGAISPVLDDIDNRYIDEVKKNTVTYTGSKTCMKGFLNSVKDAEGYPSHLTFKGGEAPTDSDNDGMPDQWEIEHGLNPEYYYDSCQIYLSDEGYTNIELYINQLAGDEIKFSNNPQLKYSPDIEFTRTEEPTESVEPISVGDVDNNGFINASDALLVLKHAARIEVLVEEESLKADVNQDKSIDSEDALTILKYAAGLIEEF